MKPPSDIHRNTRERQAARTGRHPGGVRSRRGMAVLMVLLLLSLTLGLTYAAMRSQSTAGTIQRNFDRRTSARQAALTGLTVALKKMHRNDWTGVDTSINGSLNASDSFLVTYTSGDSSLPSNDPEQPYRVTLLSNGYSVDSDNPQSIAIYRVRAVVKFVPRKLADEPADWQLMMGYTVYQWTFGNFAINSPARIEGPVRMQATLQLNWDYAWWGTPRDAYHSDLGDMWRTGRNDYRPFNAPITLPTFWQLWENDTTLNTRLGIPTVNASIRTVSGLNFPSIVSTYRLYPGGKQYSIPQLPRTIEAATYRPDPATNPAGLYLRVGALDLGNDATIRGTVITAAGSGGRITIPGRRVRVEAVGLPPLLGTTEPVQLPAIVSSDDVTIAQDAEANISGLVAAYSTYQIASDRQTDTSLLHQGKLIAQNIYFSSRTDWVKTSDWWDNKYDLFHAQEASATGIKYFPEWLQKYQLLNSQPQLLIKPAATSIRYHWHNPQKSIYVADPTDGGLRWDLLTWTENV